MEINNNQINYNFNFAELDQIIDSLNKHRNQSIVSRHYQSQLDIINSLLVSISLLITKDKDDYTQFRDLNTALDNIKKSMILFNLKPRIQKKILQLLIIFIAEGKKGLITNPKIKNFIPKPKIAKALASIYVPDFARQLGGSKYRSKKQKKSIKRKKITSRSKE